MSRTRTKRPPEERRSQFLDCAADLFFTRGYEQTTVNDIIGAAGLSKGAFYHYFDSKESLVEALAERVGAQTILDAEAILEDPDLDALARLNAFLERSREWKIERALSLRVMFTAVLKAENALLNQRLIATMSRVMGPVIDDIVREGVREGVFDPPAPGLVAEVVMNLGAGRIAVAVEAMHLAERGELDAATRRLEARLADETAVIERVLGAPQGSVRVVEPGFVRAMLAAWS